MGILVVLIPVAEATSPIPCPIVARSHWNDADSSITVTASLVHAEECPEQFVVEVDSGSTRLTQLLPPSAALVVAKPPVGSPWPSAWTKRIELVLPDDERFPDVHVRIVDPSGVRSPYTMRLWPRGEDPFLAEFTPVDRETYLSTLAPETSSFVVPNDSGTLDFEEPIRPLEENATQEQMEAWMLEVVEKIDRETEFGKGGAFDDGKPVGPAKAPTVDE